MTRAEKENTKLIVEFLGGKVHIAYQHNEYIDYAISGALVLEWRKNKLLVLGGLDDRMMLDNCMFDKSWEWLMMVVDKIEKINNDGRGKTYQVWFLPYEIEILSLRDGHSIRKTVVRKIVDATKNEGKKIAVFEAVLEFINLYNKDAIYYTNG